MFTFNIPDFAALAQHYHERAGIVLAAQSTWTLRGLIRALDRALTETCPDDWAGQVRWLDEWRPPGSP